MLHPVGSHPASVYWRRRAVLLGAAFVLVLVTMWVLRPGGGDSQPVAGSGSPSHSTTQNTAGSPAGTTSLPPSTQAHSSVPKSSPGTSAHTSAAPLPCTPAALKIAAAAGAPTYHVGDQPVVMLQVTNVGTVPCVQDLADPQIELRVYNGESRVWGSHDCTVQPGTDLRTLAAGQSVRVSIVWSGLSSQPQCAGTRQRVGAGTYTLYPRLSGRDGAAAQFSIV